MPSAADEDPILRVSCSILPGARLDHEDYAAALIVWQLSCNLIHATWRTHSSEVWPVEAHDGLDAPWWLNSKVLRAGALAGVFLDRGQQASCNRSEGRACAARGGASPADSGTHVLLPDSHGPAPLELPHLHGCACLADVLPDLCCAASCHVQQGDTLPHPCPGLLVVPLARVMAMHCWIDFTHLGV